MKANYLVLLEFRFFWIYLHLLYFVSEIITCFADYSHKILLLFTFCIYPYIPEFHVVVNQVTWAYI
jgi:hypothetical protein